MEQWTNYSEEDNRFIIENIDKMPQAEIARRLNRSYNSLTGHIMKLRRRGVLPKETSRKYWTDEENRFLLEHAETMSLCELSKILGRARNTLSYHLKKLKDEAANPKRKTRVYPIKRAETKRKAKTSDRDTLCWTCRKATNPVGNDCPWSGALRPVPGWHITTYTRTYQFKGKTFDETHKYVDSCPLFEEG